VLFVIIQSFISKIENTFIAQLTNYLVMSKNINVELSDEEYEELKKFKDRKYLTWKGVLVHGTPLDRDV